MAPMGLADETNAGGLSGSRAVVIGSSVSPKGLQMNGHHWRSEPLNPPRPFHPLAGVWGGFLPAPLPTRRGLGCGATPHGFGFNRYI